jgi:hypothetical protein
LAKDKELLKYLDSCSLFRLQLLNELEILLSLIEDDSKVLKNIRETYGLLEQPTFNIFEPIDKYWHEDFHEIILLQILNPKTKEIGKLGYLHIFTDLLHMINKKYDKNYNFDKDVVVENQIGDKDHGYIDILISDDSKAIIIESKINGAPDQDNQLARYYRYVTKELKKEILAIVYLRPVYDENKMPPFDEYSEEYTEEMDNCKKLLIPLSVVNSKNKIDLCHGFLDACYEIDNIDKAKIYIKQYSELLKTLGGNKMAINIEKEMFKKLFGTTSNVANTNDIGEIWDNRWFILASLIQDALVKDKGFKPDGDRYSNKKITDKISLTFIYDPDYKKIGDVYVFGFSFDPINQKTKKDLEKILTDIGSENILDKNIETVEDWVIIRKFIFGLDKTVDEIITEIVNLYTQLEKEAKKILEI